MIQIEAITYDCAVKMKTLIPEGLVVDNYVKINLRK